MKATPGPAPPGGGRSEEEELLQQSVRQTDARFEQTKSELEEEVNKAKDPLRKDVAEAYTREKKVREGTLHAEPKPTQMERQITQEHLGRLDKSSEELKKAEPKKAPPEIPEDRMVLER